MVHNDLPFNIPGQSRCGGDCACTCMYSTTTTRMTRQLLRHHHLLLRLLVVEVLLHQWCLLLCRLCGCTHRWHSKSTATATGSHRTIVGPLHCRRTRRHALRCHHKQSLRTDPWQLLPCVCARARARVCASCVCTHPVSCSQPDGYHQHRSPHLRGPLS